MFFEPLVVGLLVIIVIQLYFISMRQMESEESRRKTYREVMNIKTQVFTRQNRASMQSGARTELQDLEQLGRVSRSNRVVVGGDDESQLHHDLSQSRQSSQSTRVGGQEEENDA